RRYDRHVCRRRFLQCAILVAHLLEWSPADVPATAGHQRSLLRSVPGQNREPKSDSYASHFEPETTSQDPSTSLRMTDPLCHCSSGGSLPIKSLIRSASCR